jgi:hypothetical protein
MADWDNAMISSPLRSRKTNVGPYRRQEKTHALANAHTDRQDGRGGDDDCRRM